ncbi:enteropeptidase-like [Ixodes scapularis]|uniref:enteropeptidase-like n=1 Tax=Ixodes scapularis TaxID=6945 RepID=UPI001A9F838F|nr:enteropeptidase-like [Ixodes scapularis]
MNSLFLVFVYTMALLYESASPARTDEKDTQYKCGKRQKEKHISGRIINGTEALPEHWPWMVAIYNSNDTLLCGGVLIGEKYVVTATHCFLNKDGHEFSVRLGTTLETNVSQCNAPQDQEYNDNPESQVICAEVDSICTPIQNNCGLFMKDIAVVKLKTKVKYTDYIQPICLPENCVDPPATASSASYAAEYHNSDKYEETKLVVFRYANTLMERKLHLMDQEQCSAQMKSEVPGYIICTSGGACYGDSGGPLIYEDNGRWTLIGVISDGPDNCLYPERPLLFVKVSHFVDSLISKFMEPGSHSDKNSTCATENARKECVTKFYQFYNQSVEP